MTGKDFAAIFGTLAAGIMSIAAFVNYRRRRAGYPRKEMTHEMLHRRVCSDKRFVRVTIRVKNVGEVLLRLAAARITLRRVLPVQDEFYEMMVSGVRQPTDESQEIQWPLLGYRSWMWPKSQTDLEPGETETIIGDFIIDSDIKTVESYSFVVDYSAITDPPVGWRLAEIHDITDDEPEGL